MPRSFFRLVACSPWALVGALSVGALIAVASAERAAADDTLTTKTPASASPGSAYNWNGFYAGGQLGYAWGQSNWTASVAIENARLFEAEQQRSRELTESLEQQTATSEVLRVISGSPGELEPVFQAMLENATRICEAKFANLFLYEDSSFRVVALQNAPQAYAERWRVLSLTCAGTPDSGIAMSPLRITQANATAAAAPICTPVCGRARLPEFDQMRPEGVPFIYQDQPACFWPPEQSDG
jgi:hypothetical protein